MKVVTRRDIFLCVLLVNINTHVLYLFLPTTVPPNKELDGGNISPNNSIHYSLHFYYRGTPQTCRTLIRNYFICVFLKSHYFDIEGIYLFNTERLFGTQRYTTSKNVELVFTIILGWNRGALDKKIPLSTYFSCRVRIFLPLDWGHITADTNTRRESP